MPEQKSNEISRDRLAELLNEDLSREYQAIIAYVVYSQVLKGAEYMDIAAQLEIHAKQELDHALILSRQIDYLGKMPVTSPKPVRTSKNAKDMLRYDLDNENETIRNYRDRIPQCEALGEYAMAEQIREILVQEQDHQIDLATALGEEVPNVNAGPRRGYFAQASLTLLATVGPVVAKIARLRVQLRRMSNVEAIKVHHLVPSRYKVVDELFLRIRTSVDFGQCAELRV